MTPLFHVVLVAPQIPNNTGNIGRTCVATGSALHLVHPLAFDTSDKACRRAGLDYWPRLSVFEHASWDAFLAATSPPGERIWLLTTKASRSLFPSPSTPTANQVALSRGDFLVFGNEGQGLPESILVAYPDRLISLPMVPGERSLNLATAVCTVVYEGVRQALARGTARLDPQGRLLPDETTA
ncbi:MAG TPA: tRNA (cytidine(34)-2'-O)-methyltransferase [Phycisphaerales bacterium]|nr:tRNA (cytidine(34)-2'-O)-methyltransferase [Phycisphaerales bacterium]